MQSVYIMSAERAYAERTRQNETKAWETGALGYHKLNKMSKLGLVKGLPKLEFCTDTVCAGFF